MVCIDCLYLQSPTLNFSRNIWNILASKKVDFKSCLLPLHPQTLVLSILPLLRTLFQTWPILETIRNCLRRMKQQGATMCSGNTSKLIPRSYRKQAKDKKGQAGRKSTHKIKIRTRKQSFGHEMSLSKYLSCTKARDQTSL